MLGIDVGYSENKRTTSFCVLAWTETAVDASFSRVSANAEARKAALQSILPVPAILLGVAIDGPLLPALQPGSTYRAAEALLSQGLLQKRGKPGQTSSPVGQSLNRHAIALAELTLSLAEVAPASHREAIHSTRLVEAFPNIFLAALIDEAALPSLKRNATDRYWECCVASRLPALLGRLLPGRTPRFSLSDLRNHDDRAGLVCALTALAVLSDTHVAVGAPADGDIMLPPTDTWGQDADGNLWLERELRKALRSWAHPKGRADARVAGLPKDGQRAVVV